MLQLGLSILKSNEQLLSSYIHEYLGKLCILLSYHPIPVTNTKFIENFKTTSNLDIIGIDVCRKFISCRLQHNTRVSIYKETVLNYCCGSGFPTLTWLNISISVLNSTSFWKICLPWKVHWYGLQWFTSWLE